ncbi:Ldh family oxidoreductase [soil metagenome]
MPSFNASYLRETARRVFEAVGSQSDVASRVSDALVDANLAGHDSHGVIRIPQYVQHVRAGQVIADARPEIIDESPTTALVNGNWAFGQVSAAFATRLAMEKARQNRLAAVGIVRCTHIGRLGEYPTMAADEGLIAFVTAGGFGGPGGAAPFGGSEVALGTNPLSIGFPGKETPSMLVDFATTSVAAGKISVARAKGEQLPPGSIIDREGRPSTDPEDFYNGGMLLPFGGHKGYSLGLVVEMLGRVLTGADEYAQEGRGGPVYGRSGTFIIALDPGMFRPNDDYRAEVDRSLDRIKRVKPAPGFNEVLVPGEPELRARAQREREGIPIAEATWSAIRATASELGVDVDAVQA